MKQLSTLNGWQRLWFVGTCLALVGFGMIYPLSKYRLEQLQIGVTVHIGLVLAASALVYFLGFLVAWIRRGFRKAV